MPGLKIGNIDVEKIGRIIAFGFGDKVLVGALLSILKRVTPDDVMGYIASDSLLLPRITDKQWLSFSKAAKGAHMKPLTVEVAEEWLTKNRIDLMGIILNSPGGEDWFSRQIDIINHKLGVV